jgi:glucoamylase
VEYIFSVLSTHTYFSNHQLRKIDNCVLTIHSAILMTEAFGAPGIEPRWTHGDKEGVGTSYNTASRIWFTLWKGIVTEIYFPNVDTPQTRDFQLLITDGETFFDEEKKLPNVTSRMDKYCAGYSIKSGPENSLYSIEKEVITDPHIPAVIVHYRIISESLDKLKVYILCAPHLNGEGKHNNGSVIDVNGKKFLYAEKGHLHMAISSTAEFTKTSVGFVGFSDGWTDISRNLGMNYEFTSATDGNIALTAEISRESIADFTVSIAFGDSRNNAVLRAIQSILVPFEISSAKFSEQWKRAHDHLAPLDSVSHDGGNLYRSSYNVLLSHEDKVYEGAIIASLSIPWGQVAGDDNKGGYHLVWSRDMYNSATALLAAGDRQTSLNALVFLVTSQQPDGGFPQNFWLNGEPYWKGIQLDETAFAIILAWRCLNAGMKAYDPYIMVLKAAQYLITKGPVTQQERWEEASGYSPSTLASNITAMICAASIARMHSDNKLASLFEDYADFLYCHIEAWTVTQEGTLVPGIKRHFIRILPASPYSPDDFPDLESSYLKISNLPPGANNVFRASEVVDGGFLELVRYGIMKPDDPLILDSVHVIDELLKIDTPYGPTWHRYNHDGYGEREDGSPFVGYGKGRGWPLLTGERGHYEIARGSDPTPYIKALEKFCSTCAMLSEQVWDSPSIPEKHLFLGRHTGSARPLAWAHAEYIKLLASAKEGKVFDLVEDVRSRYCGQDSHPLKIEVWKPGRRIRECKRDFKLRILHYQSFVLHIGTDGWQNPVDIQSDHVGFNFYSVHIPATLMKANRLDFTFFYPEEGRWEGKDFSILLI